MAGMSKFRTFALLLAVSTLLLAGVSACGRSDGGSSTTGSDREQELKFAQCMREHGVDMPDPGVGGLVTGDGPTADESGAATAIDTGDGSAFEACRKFLPNGGEPSKPTAAELEQMIRYAQCMREHGIDMPDPGADGVLPALEIQADDDAQRYEAAARACDAATSPAPTK
jgi:hypothetical protein